MVGIRFFSVDKEQLDLVQLGELSGSERRLSLLILRFYGSLCPLSVSASSAFPISPFHFCLPCYSFSISASS